MDDKRSWIWRSYVWRPAWSFEEVVRTLETRYEEGGGGMTLVSVSAARAAMWERRSFLQFLLVRFLMP